MGGSEPADTPRARPKRIRPAPKPLKWRRAPWFGLAFIALVAGILNALGVGKPRPAASAPAPVIETPAPRAVVPAVVPGWQAVAGQVGSYAYDVPPDWQPAPDTQQSWAGAGIRLITSAFLGRNACGRAPLGGAGVTTEPVADPEAAARKAATDLTTAAYGGTLEAEPGTDAEITKADGTKAPARVVVAQVMPGTGECAAKHALVAAMGFGSGAGASGVVVAYADSDRAGGSVRDDLLRIVRSYRFVPNPTTPPR
ncbi:hypothetical protein [Amycolatopsis australiensis]|uniref:DUF8017 domain-containing protein n=1 Tax=Amycolatopsis australiensis TaxID=546364 RepID=A0A1K1T2Q8_9PSEU|nr:hypothetical protein [Amycolatopsis australiensis]SFW90880.1 hypothetical protein SAMN04489730_7740 [Amycolatopsis australiensis]